MKWSQGFIYAQKALFLPIRTYVIKFLQTVLTNSTESFPSFSVQANISWYLTYLNETEQNFTKSNEISQHKTIFLSHFVIFQYVLLSLSMILKDFCKILVSVWLFHIFKISDLAMAKDEKIIIAVTYHTYLQV